MTPATDATDTAADARTDAADRAAAMDPRTMVAYAAFLLAVGVTAVGLGLVGQGSLITGWFAFAGIGGLNAALHARGTARTERVQRSVGDANGESLTTMLMRMDDDARLAREHEQYQHDRNHAILNALQRIDAKLADQTAAPSSRKAASSPRKGRAK